MKVKFIFGLLAIVALLFAACQNEQTLEFDRYYSSGSVVYQTHCKNCHGVHGEGLQDLVPPLTDSVFLKSNLHKLPCVVQNGLKGNIEIGNRSFEGEMTKSNLNPLEIAQVLTYINNSFGNKLGMMTLDEVSADLEKCR